MEQGNRSKGYTLVELLISLAVVISLSSLLLPSLTSTNTRHAVNLKIWEIKRHLEDARSLLILVYYD